MEFVPHHLEFDGGAVPGARCLFLLHGIFGSARNWKSFAAALARACPGWRVIAVDLRHHGASKGAPPPNTIDACAGDLEALARRLGTWPEAVVGHSFGGKVALAYARARPPRLATVISLDSPPGPGELSGRTPSNTEVGRVLRALREMPMPAASRSEVTRELERRGVARAVAQWMATNLQHVEAGGDGGDGEGYAWQFDVAALDELIADYWATDMLPFLEAPPEGLALHFVRAERSDRFSVEEIAVLERLARARKIELHVLPDAGHWVHVDNPAALQDLLRALLA